MASDHRTRNVTNRNHATWQVGRAINDTFKLHHVGLVQGIVAPCDRGVATVAVTGPFDYVVTMEDLSQVLLIRVRVRVRVML